MATTVTLTFPALPSGKRMDSARFSYERTDPGMRAEMEGGYAITRARFTRPPRKIFTVGFTMITDADRNAIDAFYETTRGSSRMFTWRNVEDGKDYVVRFKGKLSFTYKGAGTTKFWDCGAEFEEV